MSLAFCSVGGHMGGKRRAPYPKPDLPVSAHLQVEPVWAIPVAVDNVYFAVPVKVSQGHPTPMLVRVVHTWGTKVSSLRHHLLQFCRHSRGGGSRGAVRVGPIPLSQLGWQSFPCMTDCMWF